MFSLSREFMESAAGDGGAIGSKGAPLETRVGGNGKALGLFYTYYDTLSDGTSEEGDSESENVSRVVEEIFIPPVNFAMVEKGVYRSGYPSERNFDFLKKLKLKSILYLVPEDRGQSYRNFVHDMGIRIFDYGMEGNKEPFLEIPEETVRDALSVILDSRNHPILIHCNKGKHRTGCVVGILRKIQNWSLTSVFDEYRRFAGTKARMLDQQYIELISIMSIRYERKFLPSWLLH